MLKSKQILDRGIYNSPIFGFIINFNMLMVSNILKYLIDANFLVIIFKNKSFEVAIIWEEIPRDIRKST